MSRHGRLRVAVLAAHDPCVMQRLVCATAASVQDAWRLDPYVRDAPHTYMCISGSGVAAETIAVARSVSIVSCTRQCFEGSLRE